MADGAALRLGRTRTGESVSCEEAAVREHLALAYWVASQFRFPGADRDDVRQEALVALLDGLRRYELGPVPLDAWLAVVIRRRLSSRLRDHQREKHRVLTDAVRTATNEDGDAVPILSVTTGRSVDAFEHALSRERVAWILASMGGLSPLERRSLLAYAHRPTVGRAEDNGAHRAVRKLSLLAGSA